MNHVLTLGTFDLPHWGHANLLRKCEEIADYGKVFVGLNTDDFVKRYKGKAPLMSWEERLKALRCFNVDFVAYENNQADGTIKDVVEKVIPTHIVVGSDWLKKNYLEQIGLTPKYLEEKDIILVFVPYTYGISTSELKRRLHE